MARKRPSIVYQTLTRLDELKKFGQSKRQAILEEKERCIKTGEQYIPGRVEGIYSFETYRSYKEWCLKFVEWVRNEKGVKTLEAAREYVKEYLEKSIKKGNSAWTVRLQACALAKLYGCRSTDFGVKMPVRRKEDIRRSRGPKVRDKSFSEEKNKDLIDFCKGTGLIRRELIDVRPQDIVKIGDEVYVRVRRGKGGKERVVRVLGQYREHVLEMCNRAKQEGKEKIFEHIPGRADIYGYRREYAKARYREIENSPEKLEQAKKLWAEYKKARNCRYDEHVCRNGQTFNKAILLEISHDLGLNNIDEIPTTYLIE